METNLENLCWNPHTCSCKLTYHKEETAVMPPKVSRYLRGQGEHFRGLPEWHQRVIRLYVHPDDHLYVYQSRFQTVTEFLKRAVKRIFHDYDEEPPPTGTRVRAKLVRLCPEHGNIEPETILQTQMAWNDSVCRCRWFELCIGDREKGERFGHRMIEVCFEHAEVPYSAIPELVYAAGRKLEKVHEPKFWFEERDGAAVLIHRNASGVESDLVVGRLASKPKPVAAE